ncbi:MAG: CopG family transcriptional regulator [Blastocatellia bacterium]|nr:CopG family transcriptional regulator [Blastocatellia bacterium]
MKKKTIYTDEPIGKIKVVKDFLPKPEDLVFREDNVKVTLSLSRQSLDFFKEQAKLNRTQYQKMIRRLLDVYVTNQKA